MAINLKLSKRLTQIQKMVTGDYARIWDCCCDHGFLGVNLLSQQAAPNIHFVDIVPDLITQIENKLQQGYSNSISAWQTHCLDVSKLPLELYEGKHLVIIAGVGGDLSSQLITEIKQRQSSLDIDFLLCPANRQFTLRQKLISLNFSLKDEVLVEDKQRFYEVMLVSSRCDETAQIHPVGTKIWQSETSAQIDITKKYLEKTLNYYRRIQQGNTNNVDAVVRAYESVNI